MKFTFKNAVKSQVRQRLLKARRVYRKEKNIELTAVESPQDDPLDDSFSIEVGPESICPQIADFLNSMNLPVDDNGEVKKKPAPSGSEPVPGITPEVVSKSIREALRIALGK